MDKSLKILLDNSKLDQLYKNNLFSLKSICTEISIWETYSPEDKFKLENFTKKDTTINKHFTYRGNYNSNFTYSEVTRNGANILIDKINKYKKPNKNDVFIDIGCGAGKLVLNMAISSTIETLIGVEIVPQRLAYAKYIKEQIMPIDKSIFFIEKDILQFDLSHATIAFINDYYFDSELVEKIYNKIPSGCHFITTHKIDSCKIFKENFLIQTSDNSITMNYYIK